MAKVPGVLWSLREIPGEASTAMLPVPRVTHTPFPTQAGTAKNTRVSPSPEHAAEKRFL